jgi:hypothetical protein
MFEQRIRARSPETLLGITLWDRARAHWNDVAFIILIDRCCGAIIFTVALGLLASDVRWALS